jgi:hypothetical protein
MTWWWLPGTLVEQRYTSGRFFGSACCGKEKLGSMVLGMSLGAWLWTEWRRMDKGNKKGQERQEWTRRNKRDKKGQEKQEGTRERSILTSGSETV